MPSVVATFKDGLQLAWRDGEVTGDPVLAGVLDATADAVEWAQALPEGPLVKLSTYRSDPQAFIAVAKLVHPQDSLPALTFDGDVGSPAPPPEGAN